MNKLGGDSKKINPLVSNIYCISFFELCFHYLDIVAHDDTIFEHP